MSVAETEKPAVISFEDVIIGDRRDFDSGLEIDALRILEGDLVTLSIAHRTLRLPIADAAMGLLSLDRGRIRFLGEDWSNIPENLSILLRSKIGRFFPDGGWISNLDIDENILLPGLHSGAGTEAELRRRAVELARRFGFEALPGVRPAQLSRSDSRRAQLIRLFLLDTRLLIFEHPEVGLDDDTLASLGSCLQEHLTRGGAALWITREGAAWKGISIPISRTYTMQGARVVSDLKNAGSAPG